MFHLRLCLVNQLAIKCNDQQKTTWTVTKFNKKTISSISNNQLPVVIWNHSNDHWNVHFAIIDLNMKQFWIAIFLFDTEFSWKNFRRRNKLLCSSSIWRQILTCDFQNSSRQKSPNQSQKLKNDRQLDQHPPSEIFNWKSRKNLEFVKNMRILFF